MGSFLGQIATTVDIKSISRDPALVTSSTDEVRTRGSVRVARQEAARMDAPERREQILNCAMRLFEQKPYSAVMLRDVAEAAGVGRPLVHHYFGTKRDLYLEVLRRLAFIPLDVLDGIPDGSLEDRVSSGFERWLSVAERHRNMWLAIITMPTASGDPEVDQILREADRIAAERMIQVMGLEQEGGVNVRLLALVTAFGGLARSSCREWLIDGSLSKRDVLTLLSHLFLTLIRDVAPEVGALPR